MNFVPKTPSTFQDFWAMGFRRLVPVIPPDGEIRETSSLYKRIAAGQDARGKVPGVKGADGKWHSFDWTQREADETDLRRWASMGGAGIGVKMGEGLHLIDADSLDKAHAALIQQAVVKHVGVTPVRIGNFPKAGYLCRVSEPIKYCRVDFGPLTERNQSRDRVEILSDGRFAVFHGIHPKTKSPYIWPFPLVPFAQLPVATPATIVALLEELRSILPAAKPIVTEGAAAQVSQASLRGDLDAVRNAVEATPNTSAAFPTRESYLEYGYAIKAALPDHPDEAFELFSAWCSRWRDGENAPDVVAADWTRMKSPFRIGASRLFELAEQHSGGRFKRADAWFDEIPDEPQSLFAPPHASASTQRDLEPLIVIDPTAWSGQQARPREWIVDGWMPKGEVTLLYGDGGVGKSLLAMQFATCAATGRPWLGQATQPARVMGFFCEDSEDELLRRQIDINRALGVDFAELTGLRLICRKHSDNVFALWDRQTGALKLQPVWHQFVAAAKAFRADVVIVDTIADVYAGSEIDRVQVNAFVKGVLGRLGKEIGGTVLALGHPSVAGKQSGEGTSGSTAWNNAVRSRLYLKHPKGADGGNTRVLEGRKANYGPKGSQLIIRYNHGAFEMLAGSLPATQHDGVPAAPAVVSIGEAVERAVVAVLMANPNERLSMAPNSQYYAVKILRGLDPDALAPFSDDKVVAAIRSLARREVIREERVGSTEHGRAIHGYVVLPEKIAAPPLAAEQPTVNTFDRFDEKPSAAADVATAALAPDRTQVFD